MAEAATHGRSARAAAARTRVPALSFFFPAHNEAENIEALVAEALEELPKLADEFEIIAVDDGSRDGTPQIADRLAAGDPRGPRRSPRGQPGLRRGAAQRASRASRYPLVAFTDGDRQFKVADLGRLLERMAKPDTARTSSSATASSAPIRPSASPTRASTDSRCGSSSASTSATSTAPASSSGARRSRASGSNRGGAFLSAELLIKLKQRGRTHRRGRRAALPAHGRVSASGAKPKVVLARGARLLAAAASAVGQPRAARSTQRRAGRAASVELVEPALSRTSAPLSDGPGSSGRSTFERVDELAEDGQLLVLGALGNDAGPVEHRSVAKIGTPARMASAIASLGPRVDLHLAAIDARAPAARGTSRQPGPRRRSARPSRRARSSVGEKRSWVSGRSGVTPWSRMAMAFASHGPIQMGR